ncbi:MAG: YigZ family protein [Crocinitomicaceae bacterium]|nr:YigZ family protein [Crocinitomicaceae bacterium]
MNAASSYRIVKSITEGLYREKGSKFLAFVIPCDNAADAKKHIDDFWKKHPGAVHVCYAWRFGKSKFEDRISDDGEPSGSAGKPIFGQIISFDLTNILIAVVRYYGGTNLGVGGLMQAYKAASKDALDKAIIEEKELCDYYKITFNFDLTGDVMNLLQRRNAEIISQEFSETGSTLNFAVSQKLSALLPKDFEPLHQLHLEKTGTDQ